MESAYRSWEKRRERTGSAHTTGRRKGKLALGPREQRRLVQLGVCIALFLVVFVGKGVFPNKMVALREELTGVITADTDFRAAFSSLGRAISNGEPVLETMGDLFVTVFGGSQVTIAPPIEKLLPTYQEQKVFLGQPVTAQSILEHSFGIRETPQPTPVPTVDPAPPAETTPPVEPAPAPEPAIIPMEYSGPALPANATMDKYTLHIGQTVCPVSGWWASSAFGWREHPVDGEEKFHNGADLAVNNGSKVLAFADGVVDYIGESPIYGLYTQITHGDGVTSFYAHNSKLLVQQGQNVKAGDKIAESGDTGNATGPHLHFEIKKDGKLLNPLYYIDSE